MAKFGEWSPYSGAAQTPQKAKCKVLTVDDLFRLEKQGRAVFWHPDGPLKWVNKDAEQQPMWLTAIRTAKTVPFCFTISVARVDNDPIGTNKDGNPIYVVMRTINKTGYHHKERTPVFTDIHPTQGGAAATELKHAPKEKPNLREQGEGIKGPYGTAADQENEERWGPLHEHDPHKHCKACGKKGGCLCPKDKQVDDA